MMKTGVVLAMKAALQRAHTRRRPPTRPPNPELTRWIGRRIGMTILSGRCTPADIESLGRIHAERLYRRVCRSWREFCAVQLGCHRSNVERAIEYLHDF